MRICVHLLAPIAIAASVIVIRLGAQAALAEPVDALPTPVIDDVRWLEQRCRDVGGEPQWTAEELIKEIDLSPDSVPDYVIETAAMDCEGPRTGRAPWISSGGAQLIVWASVGRNRWAKVFDAHVFAWNVIRHKSQPVFYVLQDIGYCGKRISRTDFYRCAHEYVMLNGRLRQIREAGTPE